jgi:hypothetical protein
LAQAGCRVIPRAAVDGVLGTPRCRASGFASREARLLPVFHRLFQPHPTGRQVSRRGRDSAERRPMAASYTRAQEGTSGVRAFAQTFTLKPTRHPLDPGKIPSVPSSQAQKTHSASCPQEAARCRHVSQADRIATPYGCCKPDTLSAVSACRRFLDQARPPPLIPPACRPPCGRPAVRTRLLVLAGSGKQPGCHCGRFVYRPQSGCVNRASGITALSPSANPLSRLPQPDSRRLSKARPRPSTRRTPRQFRSCPAATPQARPRTGVP